MKHGFGTIQNKNLFIPIKKIFNTQSHHHHDHHCNALYLLSTKWSSSLSSNKLLSPINPSIPAKSRPKWGDGNINTKQIQILNGVKMGTNRPPKVYTATLFFLLLLNLIQNLNETKSSSYLSRQHLYSAHKIHDQTPQNCLTMLLNFSSNLLLSIDFKSWFPFDRSTLSNWVLRKSYCDWQSKTGHIFNIEKISLPKYMYKHIKILWDIIIDINFIL